MGWHLLFCLIISFVAPLTALAPAPGRAEDVSGSVNGIVVDANSGNPMEYANVALLESADSSLVTGVGTGPDGSFLSTVTIRNSQVTDGGVHSAVQLQQLSE